MSFDQNVCESHGVAFKATPYRCWLRPNQQKKDLRNVSCPNGRRFGLTLFEVVLVLAIIILFASMAFPSLQRSFQNQKVVNAAEVVRTHCNEARVAAMRESRVYAFFYQVDAGNFAVAPFDTAQQVIDQSALGADPEEIRVSQFQFELDLLPRNVVFAGDSTVSDGRSQFEMEQGEGMPTMKPVLFYPDGQCQTAEIFVMNNQTGDRLKIKVRGLTGTTSVERFEED